MNTTFYKIIKNNITQKTFINELQKVLCKNVKCNHYNV